MKRALDSSRRARPTARGASSTSIAPSPRGAKTSTSTAARATTAGSSGSSERVIGLAGSGEDRAVVVADRAVRGVAPHQEEARRAQLLVLLLRLQPLPPRRLESFKKLRVQVDSGSLIRVQKNVYSVHSRLIGEHVDYAGLPVFPMALQYAVHVAVRPRDDGMVRVATSDPTYGPREFKLGSYIEPFPDGDWGNYVKAAAVAAACPACPR